jgi:hypothetical protein
MFTPICSSLLAVALAGPVADTDDLLADDFREKCAQKMQALDREFGDGFWTYFYDDGVMPRPYLIAAEHKPNIDKETVEKEYADIFGCLMKEFYREYGPLLDLHPITDPVVVRIFASRESYKELRESRPELGLPNEEFIAGYFDPATGILTQWRQGDLWHVLFHEGTHQLVDACLGKDVPQYLNTPWFQEGIAEYFGSHTRELVYDEEAKAFVNKFSLGQFNEGRYQTVQHAILDKAAKMSLKDMAYLDFMSFKGAQNSQEGNSENQVVTGRVYALGWAFVLFLNTASDGAYKDAFNEYFVAESKGEAGGDKLAEVLALESDEDWENLQVEFEEWVFGDLRRLGIEHRKKK